jgi:L-ribulose-5-phosphate 3-epimerase
VTVDLEARGFPGPSEGEGSPGGAPRAEARGLQKYSSWRPGASAPGEVMNDRKQSRREVLKALGAAPLLAAGAQGAALPQAQTPGTPTLCLVSRHLQWTSMEDGVAVAAEAGCRAIAWTVRAGAHMLPENVERDLPRAVELARKAGLAAPMVITAITDASSPRVEAILDTMRSVGIRHYRAASFRYDYAGDLEAQLDALAPRVEGLVRLNEKYGTTAMYHTQSSAGTVGGGVWDLWTVLRRFDPRYVGINYDLGHATIRGGTGWMETSRVARRFVHGLSVKDFRWTKGGSSGRRLGAWSAEMVPPGEGMVDFAGMFSYFKSAGFAGPIELYQEYSVTVPGRAEPVNMLGTNYGTWKLEMPRAEYLALLKRDVAFYTSAMRGSGWAV